MSPVAAGAGRAAETARQPGSVASAAAGDAIFAARNISLDLGGREILRDIGFEIAPGEVLGIIGPNGAGKTSLLEVVSGRIRPKSGRVIYRDRDITSTRLHQRARLGIGRTYQTPVVPEELTVGEAFKAARQAFRPYLTRFDAEYGAELVHFHAPNEMRCASLETINRRKLLLACLLMRRPSVMLLDEPAAGLINSEIDEIDHLIRRLSKEMQIGIVIVEHRIELLDKIADRVMVMDAGEMIASGSLAEILDNPRVHAAYFENVELDDEDDDDA
jgi:branched-chain amino acid transport system ATP-binding protein